MSGHATPDQLADIEARIAAVNPATSPAAELIDLALLLLEPAHREDVAINLLETLLGREPENGEARIWLAYALLHFRLDEAALRRAADLLTPLLNHPTHAAAAHLLLAEVRDEQVGDLDERIALLERSVALAPDWVSNRQDLAWAYSEAGRQEDATAQLNQAIGAVRAADPSWSIQQREFEESITGRAAAGTVERLREDLRELTT
jgi:tetratricopeptide (TPR) repeat protein